MRYYQLSYAGMNDFDKTILSIASNFDNLFLAIFAKIFLNTSLDNLKKAETCYLKVSAFTYEAT